MHHLVSIIAAALLPFGTVGASAETEPLPARIARVINNLQPLNPIRNQPMPKRTLSERMAHYQTPGVSIAIINDGAIEWAGGFGVKHWRKSARVDDRTLFQAASISKMVFAVAVMRLVQDGKIDLDADINTYLTSYKVPSNGDWQPGITIRQILNHSAGLTVSGFPGYSSDDSLPVIRDVLEGKAPANTGRVQVNIIPGLQSRYAGGGTILAQVAITDFLKRDFPTLMEELVFEPLAMRDSTFVQPLPRRKHKQAATGHPWRYRALQGKWHVYPEQAAAGLWTTPTDLAKFGLALQQVLRDHQQQFLSSNSVAAMLTPFSDENVGLGVFIEGKGDNERSATAAGTKVSSRRSSSIKTLASVPSLW
jgi:CubicO group peptidase (beta-lactamase class C family)